MLSALLQTPIRIVRRSTSEDDFDPVFTDAEIDVLGAVQQRQRQEVEGVVGKSDWALFLPPDTPIDTNDVVFVGSTRFEVIGDAWEVINPMTQEPHHIEASLKRMSGEGT